METYEVKEFPSMKVHKITAKDISSLRKRLVTDPKFRVQKDLFVYKNGKIVGRSVWVRTPFWCAGDNINTTHHINRDGTITKLRGRYYELAHELDRELEWRY